MEIQNVPSEKLNNSATTDSKPAKTGSRKPTGALGASAAGHGGTGSGMSATQGANSTDRTGGLTAVLANNISLGDILAIEQNKKENAEVTLSYQKQLAELRSSRAQAARPFRVSLEDPAIVKRFAYAFLKNDAKNIFSGIGENLDLNGQTNVGKDFLEDSTKLYDRIYKQIDRDVPEMQKPKYLASLDKAFIEHNVRHAYSGGSQIFGKAAAEDFARRVGGFSDMFVGEYSSARDAAGAFELAAGALAPQAQEHSAVSYERLKESMGLKPL